MLGSILGTSGTLLDRINEITAIANNPKKSGYLDYANSKNPARYLPGYEDFLKDMGGESDIGKEEFLAQLDPKDPKTSYKQILSSELEKRRGNKIIQDLIGSEKGKFDEYFSGIKGERASRRAKLANILRGEMETAMSQEAPSILESLSSRNLLHSSGVGEALARRKGELATDLTNKLAESELSDLDYEQGLQTGMFEKELGLGEAGLQRQFSLDDYLRESQDAEKIARITGNASRDAASKAADASNTSALIGGGLGLVGLLI